MPLPRREASPALALLLGNVAIRIEPQSWIAKQGSRLRIRQQGAVEMNYLLVHFCATQMYKVVLMPLPRKTTNHVLVFFLRFF